MLQVKDCTLVFLEDGSRHVMIMSSAGHIYFQTMNEESSARHGPFYVTNIMDVNHADLKDSSEQIGGGGVSIFYYHPLQMLFFSYVQGKSFMAPLKVRYFLKCCYRRQLGIFILSNFET